LNHTNVDMLLEQVRGEAMSQRVRRYPIGQPSQFGAPREEPGALAAHAGICTGGGWQRPSLPCPSRYVNALLPPRFRD
jgi:hypothetical protein